MDSGLWSPEVVGMSRCILYLIYLRYVRYVKCLCVGVCACVCCCVCMHGPDFDPRQDYSNNHLSKNKGVVEHASH